MFSIIWEKRRKKMRNCIVVGGVVFTLFLLISSAVAAPVVQWDQQKKVMSENQENIVFSEKLDEFFRFDQSQETDTESFLENLSSLFANLSLRFQVMFIVLFKWPMQGLRNIYNFAFVEHQFIRSALALIFQENSDDFTLKEKFIIAFTLFVRWPIQALINIVTYAFIENSFFTSLFNELKTVSLT